MDVCDGTAECQGFQLCFVTPGTLGSAVGRIRLKGGPLGALNVSNAIHNPYCRLAWVEIITTVSGASALHASQPYGITDGLCLEHCR